MPPASLASRDSTVRPPWAWLAAAALLLVLRVATGAGDYLHPPAPRERVAWQGAETAAARARGLRRPILYDFTAAWCAPCQALNRAVFADRDMAASINSEFVPVRVMDRRRETGRNSALVDSLQRAFGVAAFPTLVVVSPSGDRHETQAGFRSRRETLFFLEHARRVLGASRFPDLGGGGVTDGMSGGAKGPAVPPGGKPQAQPNPKEQP